MSIRTGHTDQQRLPESVQTERRRGEGAWPDRPMAGPGRSGAGPNRSRPTGTDREAGLRHRQGQSQEDAGRAPGEGVVRVGQTPCVRDR